MKPLADRPSKLQLQLHPPTPEDLCRRETARADGTSIIVCRTGVDGPYAHAPEWATFRFQCQWCSEVHVHGAGEGLRTSHCSSPKAPSPYYLLHHLFAEAEDGQS